MQDDIFVTNKNDFPHTDMFNGQEFHFAAGEKVRVSAEAARHMFGFGLPDKTETLTRLGWMHKYNETKKRWEDDDEGVKRLAKFVFTQGKMIEVPAEEPTKAAA